MTIGEDCALTEAHVTGSVLIRCEFVLFGAFFCFFQAAMIQNRFTCQSNQCRSSSDSWQSFNMLFLCLIVTDYWNGQIYLLVLFLQILTHNVLHYLHM